MFNTDIKIIDDFLPKKDFLFIKNYMSSFDFPWYYNNQKVYENDNYFQFSHIFLNENGINSDRFFLLEPVFKIINPKKLFRIKANCTPKSNEIITYGFHTDSDVKNGLTGILYLNSNNGYTLFKNNNKINSIENRFIVFKNNIEHTGTSCTDENVRFVINFNYI